MLSRIPFVPIEHYMLSEDRDTHPMTFFMRFRFDGAFHEERFKQAYLAAIKAQPLLTSRVEGLASGRRSGLNWIVEPPDESTLTFSASNTVPKDWTERVDLYHSTGLRMYVTRTDAETSLLVQVHHACSDAIGVIGFLESLLKYYGSGDAAQPVTNIQSIKSRGDLRLTSGALLPHLQKSFDRVRRFAAMKPDPLATQETKPTPNLGPPSLSYTFCEQTTRSCIGAFVRGKGRTACRTLARHVRIRDLGQGRTTPAASS